MCVLRKHVGDEFWDPAGYRIWVRVQQRPNAEDSTVQGSDGGRVERVATWWDPCLMRETHEPILECEDGLSRRAAQDARQSGRCHLANRDDLVIKAFADHFQDLDHSNLADQRHLSEIENLEKG